MASGVTCSSETEKTIDNIRQRSLCFALFRLNDDLTQIVVEKKFSKSDFDGQTSGDHVLSALIKELPEKQPRYAMMDFEFSNEDGHCRDAVVFVAWTPDVAPIKEKMLYASSRGSIHKAGGTVKLVQASDIGELDYKEVRAKCLK